jgi:hypothetical protein
MVGLTARLINTADSTNKPPLPYGSRELGVLGAKIDAKPGTYTVDMVPLRSLQVPLDWMIDMPPSSHHYGGQDGVNRERGSIGSSKLLPDKRQIHVHVYNVANDGRLEAS